MEIDRYQAYSVLSQIGEKNEVESNLDLELAEKMYNLNTIAEAKAFLKENWNLDSKDVENYPTNNGGTISVNDSEDRFLIQLNVGNQHKIYYFGK